jgi:hypothetical protein
LNQRGLKNWGTKFKEKKEKYLVHEYHIPGREEGL